MYLYKLALFNLSINLELNAEFPMGKRQSHYETGSWFQANQNHLQHFCTGTEIKRNLGWQGKMAITHETGSRSPALFIWEYIHTYFQCNPYIWKQDFWDKNFGQNDR